MSAQPAPANLNTEPSPQAPGQQAADAHYYRHVLHELIDMGISLARLLHQQATTHAAQPPPAPPPPHAPAPQPAPPPTPDAPTPNTLIGIATTHDRTARAVRRAIALARSLAHPARQGPSPAPRRRPPPHPA